MGEVSGDYRFIFEGENGVGNLMDFVLSDMFGSFLIIIMDD